MSALKPPFRNFPRPYILRPKPTRLLRGSDMTVCVAAACERGTKVVIATDRLLSYAGIVSDNLPGKMIWLDDWLVLYAGTPANTAMIVASLREIVKERLTSSNVRRSLLSAYRRRKATFSSFPVLSTYDLNVEAFKEKGRKIFGEEEFRRISTEIAEIGWHFNEQLLAVGWGAAPGAVMLYEISPDAERDHHLSGIAAIGSGSEVALSTMMLLGQSRDSSLSETLYAVSAAKFSSEKSGEGDVGRKTSIYIGWKRGEKDAKEKPPGKFLSEAEVNELHALWDRHGRPRISDHVYVPVNKILQSVGVKGTSSTGEVQAMMRLASEGNQRGRGESE